LPAAGGIDPKRSRDIYSAAGSSSGKKSRSASKSPKQAKKERQLALSPSANHKSTKDLK